MAGGKSKARLRNVRACNLIKRPARTPQQTQLDADIQVAHFSAIILDQVEVWAPLVVFTWREVASLLIAFLALSSGAILAGIAGGMMVSIHYYEYPTTHAPHFDGRDEDKRAAVHAQRVTILEEEMVARNVMNVPNSQGLGRVITTAKTWERNNLSVVQGATAIHVYGYGTVNSSSYLRDIVYTESTIRPSICPNGKTKGFRDWVTLRDAIREANALSAEKFLRWNEYFAAIDSHGGVLLEHSLYYEEDVVFTICPGAVLKAAKGPSIFINAENIVLECDDCIVDVGGTHLAFGPHAKKVLVRGITFKGSRTFSLTFYHDGAEVSFEDCFWFGNSRSNKFGAVADINSTR
jgi:hypothetical protein